MTSRTRPDEARLAAFPLFLLVVAAPAAPLAADIVCAGSPVTVIAWAREDAEQVRSAVQDSLILLRTMNLTLSEGVTVRPLENQIAASDLHPLGRYDAIRKEIRILPFDAAIAASAEGRPAFGVPMTRDLWRSYVAHETAHAVADGYLASGVPHLAAGEYIAGGVQLLVLTAETREAILEHYRNIGGWDSATEIAALYYYMAPAAFAIKSYRHFTALSSVEQSRFIARLVREGTLD